MKKIILSLGVMLMMFSFNINAQTDQKAKAILDKLSTKMNSLTTMKFEFVYSMYNAQDKINESKTGSIYVKDNKYRLYIEDQIVICDGKTIWTYFKEENEVQINSVDPKNQNSPNKMLTSYGSDYKAKFIKEAPSAGKIVQTIDLTPVTPQSFYKVRLEIDKTKNALISSTIYDKNNSTYTYSVKTFTENPKVNESRFTFNKDEHPGVDINDMR